MEKRRLTVGMRCRFKPDSDQGKRWGCAEAGNEVLLEERSGKEFSVMILGQKELKKEDPKTVFNQLAWVGEEDLEFVDANFEANLDFIDWYQENEENFCGDCGVWRPWQSDEYEDWHDSPCHNEECPGRKLDTGHCPYCHPDVKLNNQDKCPKCNWDGGEF